MSKINDSYPKECKKSGRILCSMSRRLKISLFALMPIIFVMCFSLFIYGISNEKLKEKFIDIQNNLELIAKSAHTKENTLQGIQYLDSLPHVFAALYDDTLSIVGERSPEVGTAPFDPRRNSDFMELIRENRSGTIPIVWEDTEGRITKRVMYTCFRWITLQDKTFLLAAGVSAYSLSSPTLNWFIGVLLGVMTILLILTLGFTIYSVKKLSYRWGYK